MATPPGGITYRTGNISVMNALNTSTEGSYRSLLHL